MMQKIRLLPPEEALKIAAGEVIERPAHVVKELLENALDAQATAISVYIEKAGKALIRIVDNGCGMSEQDAILCFQPHATSKISSINDLEQIASFGFRGEALASVASISKVTLITKPNDTLIDDLGVSIDFSENKLINQSAVACASGTDIQVRELFFNTPVRKKFLKQDETEWHATQSLVQAFSACYPHVSFKLFHDNKMVLHAPAVTNVKDRALQIWDNAFATSLVPLIDDKLHNGMAEKPPFKIHGFISNHQFWRYGRSHIHFFVNNRWVKNFELGKALLKGYLNVLPPDRFPGALVFIEIDSQYVDVNIHPKKEEVKFTKPGIIQSILTLLVKKTLEQHISATLAPKHREQPVVRAPSIPSGNKPVERVVNSQQLPEESESDLTFKELFNFSSLPKVNYAPSVQFSPPSYQTAAPIQTQTQAVVKQSDDYNIIGQMFNTYIILQTEDAMVIIDQHAAHERILYEKLQKQFLAVQGTQLLFPEVISLPALQLKKILDSKEFITKQGIEIDELSSTELVIRSCPPQLKGSSLHDFIRQAAQFIEEHESLDQSVFGQKFNEFLHGQMACKGAVKAGDILTQQQMKQLINDLQTTENRFICVHGRPTTWSVPKVQLEKQFQRK